MGGGGSGDGGGGGGGGVGGRKSNQPLSHSGQKVRFLSTCSFKWILYGIIRT